MMSFPPFAVLSLWDALGVPSTKFPISVTTVVSYVLPVVVCYFLAAVLAVTPQTRTIRIALWPVLALLALRAALSVDMSLGKPDRKMFNCDFVLTMFCLATRTLDWTLAKKPLVRHLRPVDSSLSIIMDALDLAFNLRGHGWNWSRGLRTPRETRPANRMAFAFHAFLSAATHVLIYGVLHRAILSFSPVRVGSIPEGSSIFDESLPFLVRHFRASIISIFAAFAIYAQLQVAYDLCTILAVLFFGQDPAQWPPAFDAPWCATSLSDFWGYRWHQMFRRTFLLLGGYPLSFVLGRTGILFGAFLASAVFHHITFIPLNSQIGRMLIGFGMMAPGILAEQTFHQLTGRKVGGVGGWVWTMAWLLLWGNVMTDGFVTAGMFGSPWFLHSTWPVQVLGERLVVSFDAWLHTI